MRLTRRARTGAIAVLLVAAVSTTAACGDGTASTGATGGAGSGASTVSATAASPHTGTLTWLRPAASNSFEGDKCIDTSIPLNPAIYDTLLRIQVPKGDGLAPGLAEKWSWDDKTLTYTFNLRTDAAFSNGQPLTAKDVVFSVKQWTKGEVSGSYYANVDKAVAVDDHTVQVKMKKTDTFLPALLTWCTSPIYPDNFAGATAENYFKKPISAGPYQIDQVSDPQGPAEKITLTPNTHYYGWKGAPPLASIVVQTVSDANQRALQFQSGQADLLDTVDSATASSMDPSSVVQTPTNSIDGVVLNVTAGPFKDAKVRQAVSLAFDRTALQQTLANGSVAAVGYLPVNVPGSVDPAAPYAFDEAKAKQLLADAGQSAGFATTLLYDKSDPAHDTTAQVVQAQLAKIGITVKLETTDNNTALSRLASGDYQMTFSGASAISPTIFDPISWLAVLYGWTKDPSTKIQDEFLAGTSTTDKTAQDKAAKSVQDFIMQGNALIGLVHTVQTYAVQPWVRGFAPLQYTTFYLDTLSDH